MSDDIEQSVFELIDGPTEREYIESSADYPNAKVRSTLREMLYSGKLETTPEWKYERPADTDTDHAAEVDE
jgi:hypothetical protein